MKPPAWLDPYRAVVSGVDLDHDVIGLDPQKAAVRALLARLEHRDRLASIGGRLPAGTLLHGPSGCGKTMTARAIAASLAGADGAGAEMYAIPGGVLTKARWAELGAWIAHREDPRLVVIYIDEIDALGKISPLGVRSEALTAALACMDGFDQAGRDRVMWIASSNVHPDHMDPALTRRLELWIEFEAPTRAERALLAAHYARSTPQEPIDWTRAARLMGRVSSARVVSYVHEAIARALAESPDAPRLAWRHVEAAVRAENRVARRPKASPEVISLHESGHVVAGHILGLELSVAWIHESEGLTSFSRERENEVEQMSVADARAMMAVAYAGQAAEELELGRVVLGASFDAWAAYSVAETLASHMQLPGYPPLPSSAFRSERGADQGPYFQACAALAYEERERARQIVAQHRDDVIRVAAAIQERGHLTLDDLPAILAGAGSLAA